MPAFNFASSLLKWHRQHGRHNLPWQHPRTPYRVWLSEIMLQQTQVSTVIAYFNSFIAKFPTLADLANAPSTEVMERWAGLGYYSRARNLHKSAQICLTQFNGELPHTYVDLLALPGIGRSTAGAILSQAHGMPYAILDGNVKRVLARFHGVAGDSNASATQKQLWQLAESHLPSRNLADYTQAFMDLGATVCTRGKPKCTGCPLARRCYAYQHGCITDYPGKKTAKAVPKRETVVLIVLNENNEILLEQRPNHGIWGGLFSLPEAGNAEQAKALARTFLARPDNGQALAIIKHQFSHFQLSIQPIVWRNATRKTQISDNDGYQWMARDQLAAIGMPAPIKKLLQDLK